MLLLPYATVIGAWGFLPGPYILSKLVYIALILAVVPAMRRKTPLDGAALFYLGACAVATVTSTDPIVSTLGMYGSYHGALLPTLILLLVFWNPGPRKHWVYAGAGCALFVGLQAALGVVRPWGTMGSPVFSGATMAVVAPLCPPVVAGLLLTACLATASRGALLACLVGLSIRYHKKISPRIVALGLALMAAGLVVRGASGPADRGRVLAWKMGLIGYAENRLTGTGPATFWYTVHRRRTREWAEHYNNGVTQDHAHNHIIEALSTKGSLGALALAYLFIVACWTLRRDPVGLGVLGAAFMAGFFNPVGWGTQVVVAGAVGVRMRGRLEPSTMVRALTLLILLYASAMLALPVAVAKVGSLEAAAVMRYIMVSPDAGKD